MKAMLVRNRAILLAYLGMVALLLLTSLFSPGFLSPGHLRSIAVLAAFVGIVAIGQTFVIIGGISLFGGRGGLAGTIVGAFILTIIGNLVFVLDISSYWQPIASGAILLIAVLASSIADKSSRRGLG